MSEQARRKALTAKYKQSRPEAGVYLIRNTQNRRALLGSSANLASIRSKLEFAQSITANPPSYVIDPTEGARRLTTWLSGGHASTAALRQLTADLRQVGISAFSLEVLEVLETKPEMTQAQILADLATLEGLWREKLGPARLY